MLDIYEHTNLAIPLNIVEVCIFESLGKIPKNLKHIMEHYTLSIWYTIVEHCFEFKTLGKVLKYENDLRFQYFKCLIKVLDTLPTVSPLLPAEKISDKDLSNLFF